MGALALINADMNYTLSKQSEIMLAQKSNNDEPVERAVSAQSYRRVRQDRTYLLPLPTPHSWRLSTLEVDIRP